MTFEEFIKEHPKYKDKENLFIECNSLYGQLAGPNLEFEDVVRKHFILTLLDFEGVNLMDQLQRLATLRMTFAKAKEKENL